MKQITDKSRCEGYEVHKYYMWTGSRKKGYVLEGWFDGIVEGLISKEEVGYTWIIRGKPIIAMPQEGNRYFADIESCKKDCSEYVVALMLQTYQRLVKELGYGARFREDDNTW